MMSFFPILAEHPIIILFLLANLAIGLWAHSKSTANSFEDYALASRSLPTGVLVMTLLGTFIATGDLAAPGYIFHYGILEIMALVFFILSFFIIGTFIAPHLVHFEGYITMGDLMRSFYGDKAQIVTGIFGGMISLLLITSQVKAIGEISISLVGWSPKVAILCFGSLILLYSVWGGMRPVSYTDVLQIIGALVTFSWISHVVLHKVGGIQALFNELPSEKLLFTRHPRFFYKIKSAFFWTLFPTWLLTPPMMQRMLMTRNKQQVRKVWYISSVLYLIILCMLVVTGLGAILAVEEFGLLESSDSLLLRIIESSFKGNALILDFMCISLLGILISTIDSYLHAVGVLFIHDIIEPIRKLCKQKSLSAKAKIGYTRVVVFFIGTLAILAGAWGRSELENQGLYSYVVFLSAIIIMPVMIGIVGVKTDINSWISFSTIYIVSVWLSNRWEFHRYDYFLVGLILGMLSYFFTHIYINGGIVMLKRSERTIAEQLWIPSWKGTIEYIKSWLLAPLQLPTLAARKTTFIPTQSLSFSMVIFALYTFSSVVTGRGNDLGFANFMAGVHVVGITLCVGLMLEGIWPDKLKPYFSLYWFFALFYCLSLGSTVAFLRAHGDMMAVVKWFVNLMLLAVLVDSTSFITLTCLGSGLPMVSWYVVFVSIPSDLLGSVGLPGSYLLFGLLVIVLLFERNKEKHAKGKFYFNEVFSRAITHESTQPLTEISILSSMHQRMMNDLAPMQNKEEEKGFWIPASKQGAIKEGSQQIGQAVQEIQNEFYRFNQLIGKEISILEKEKVSMHSLITAIVPTLPKKHTNRIDIKVECAKDFEPTLIRLLFTNVIANLLKNAYLHGGATQMDIHIDGIKRKLHVRDNGKGIPIEVLPYIFELRFTTGGIASSGIGLALAKIIVQASGGKISCHSRHGDKDSFTEFVIEFPEV